MSSEKTELTIRGIYFKNDYGKWSESHHGTPGVELTVGDTRVFLDYKDVSIIAKVIDRLGTSGNNSVTVRALRP